VDYATQVKPIFEVYCYQCHGNGKSKAGVRLDVMTNAMKHIMPGDARRSDVYRAITRSLGASDRMPPVSQPQPKPGEIATILVWIGQGAEWLPAVAERSNVTYAADIRPIFAQSCIPCHGEKAQRGQLRLDSLEAVRKGGERGAVIFPGKSDKGALILEAAGLDGPDMPPPPSAPPLLSHEHAASIPAAAGVDGLPPPKPWTAEEIGLVRAWLAQGAQ
jgi:mono/diheme cytochrome c family protein